jgi:hypothetical protein
MPAPLILGQPFGDRAEAIRPIWTAKDQHWDVLWRAVQTDEPAGELKAVQRSPCESLKLEDHAIA